MILVRLDSSLPWYESNNDVLHVVDLCKILLSIHCLSLDLNFFSYSQSFRCFIEGSEDGLRCPLMHGSNSNGLFLLVKSQSIAFLVESVVYTWMFPSSLSWSLDSSNHFYPYSFYAPPAYIGQAATISPILTSLSPPLIQIESIFLPD